MKLIGLDVGTRTIGIAIGFPENHLTQPICTLKRQSVKKDVPKILEICRQQKITSVVVGLPLELDGTEGRSARLARQIGDEIQASTQYDVFYQDERFSTVEATHRLREAGKNAKQQRDMIDQVAAMVILEDYMNAI